eukprot:TRINITY_DN13965_c0_g1_i4.p1 TRINITY_DN13965_c0_g1~~TRINITY_DN13965_c0_g1_i4.p1  ORF type:complete len:188 (-),score=14.49 TRINITY_DN13965_c0_g1_i4:798-1361(-)
MNGKEGKRFMIITSTARINEYQFETALNSEVVVLRMDLVEFNKKVAPFVGSDRRFGFNCTRLRNCEVVKSPLVLYPITLGIYLILLIIWIYSLNKSSMELLSAQRLLNLLFGMKIYDDAISFWLMLRCRPEGNLYGVAYLLFDANHFARPVFEGVFIYYLLSLSAVSARHHFRAPGFSGKSCTDVQG